MESMKILVIDDEAHITHVVSLKLRNLGFEVVTAGDGEEGYELARQHKPDLIITDLQMPYLTGLEMCAKLKALKETSHIPAILLTARGYALSPADLDRTNIKEVMSKPFSPRGVAEKVEEVLKECGGATEAEAA